MHLARGLAPGSPTLGGRVMPTRIIDIHPHIISTGTGRYPITPLGGERAVDVLASDALEKIRCWTTLNLTGLRLE